MGAAIMPDRAVRDVGRLEENMERHFPIKPGQSRGITVTKVKYTKEQ